MSEEYLRKGFFKAFNGEMRKYNVDIMPPEETKQKAKGDRSRKPFSV